MNYNDLACNDAQAFSVIIIMFFFYYVFLRPNNTFNVLSC